MAKIRIHELAKELGLQSKELLNIVNSLGIEASTISSGLTPEEEQIVRGHFSSVPASAPAHAAVQEETPAGTPVHILAASLGMPAEYFIKLLSQTNYALKSPNDIISDENLDRIMDALESAIASLESKATAAKKEPPEPPKKEKPAEVKPNKAAKKGKPKEKNQENADSNYKKRNSYKRDDGSKTSAERKTPSRNMRKQKKFERAEKRAMEEMMQEEDSKIIEITDKISPNELAEKMQISRAQMISKLMSLGIMNINQQLDPDTLSLIADEFGFKIKVSEAEIIEDEEDDETGELTERPPIVTIMGHVDHGKTTLLDAIRTTNVTASEAGGITQHIGAYQVKLPSGKPITFLDTPGHEAFTAMRAHGASVTDIAVLVVAADDSVKPQTIEAISHAKAAEVPIIVAINKMDKPDLNIDRVKQDLTSNGLVPEEWGGDTICVPVSAKKKMHLDTLLENIMLVAELKELKACPDKRAAGVVIEAFLDKGRGPVSTVLVQDGTLHTNDWVVIGENYGKVRVMADERGRRLKSAPPSTPVEITGISGVPEFGQHFRVMRDEKSAKALAEKRKLLNKEVKFQPSISKDDLFAKIDRGKQKELALLIKADVKGSIEALRNSLEKISNDEVCVKIVHAGVGNINESDVLLASASNASIIGFNVRPGGAVMSAAEKDNISIKIYEIIYDVIEDVKQAVIGKLTPDLHEVIEGRAVVKATFRIPKIGVIAGCYVTDGKILRNNRIRLIRDGSKVYEGKVTSLKRFKDDVREVLSGYECGIGVERYNDIKEGDEFESFYIKEVEKKELPPDNE